MFFTSVGVGSEPILGWMLGVLPEKGSIGSWRQMISDLVVKPYPPQELGGGRVVSDLYQRTVGDTGPPSKQEQTEFPLLAAISVIDRRINWCFLSVMLGWTGRIS